MPLKRVGRFVPTSAATDLAAKATALAGEDDIASATVEKFSRRTQIIVTANESDTAQDDADTVLAAAITAVGGLVQAPGTDYVDTAQP